MDLEYQKWADNGYKTKNMNFRKEEPFIILEDDITPAINLKNYLDFSKILVETGTCFGEGVKRALDAGYTDVRSVEIVEDRFNSCADRFKNDKRVTLWCGDTRNNLYDMIPEEPIVILLDAHPSGEGSGGHNELIKDGYDSEFAQQNVLVAEIKIILKTGHRHIILIDDTNTIDQAYTELLDNYKFEVIGDKYLECIPL
jgi:hypothetical protein